MVALEALAVPEQEFRVAVVDEKRVLEVVPGAALALWVQPAVMDVPQRLTPL